MWEEILLPQNISLQRKDTLSQKKIKTQQILEKLFTSPSTA